MWCMPKTQRLFVSPSSLVEIALTLPALASSKLESRPTYNLTRRAMRPTDPFVVALILWQQHHRPTPFSLGCRHAAQPPPGAVFTRLLGTERAECFDRYLWLRTRRKKNCSFDEWSMKVEPHLSNPARSKDHHHQVLYVNFNDRNGYTLPHSSRERGK